MVFLMVLYESPIVFLISLSAFRLMDPALEEQSLVYGNSVLGTLYRVTLPVMRPLMLSAFNPKESFLCSLRSICASRFAELYIMALAISSCSEI